MAKAVRAGPPGLPAWARPDHPIVREETRRWRRLRFPVMGRGGWLAAGGVFLLVLLPATCAGLIGLGASMSGREWIGLVGGTLALTAVAASWLLNWVASLAATILGATLIARDREEQRWQFLRVTPLKSTEIVGGKLASLLYLLAWPMHLAAGLRLFALLAGAVTLALVALAGGPAPGLMSDVLEAVREIAPFAPVGVLLTASVGGVDVLAGLAYWLIQPYFTGLYNSSVGLAASSLARTRGLAIGLAFVVHFSLSLGIYWPAQQVVFLIFAGLTNVFGTTPAGSLPSLLLASTLQFAVLIALQVGVMAGCLALAVQRVERLGD